MSNLQTMWLQRQQNINRLESCRILSSVLRQFENWGDTVSAVTEIKLNSASFLVDRFHYWLQPKMTSAGVGKIVQSKSSGLLAIQSVCIPFIFWKQCHSTGRMKPDGQVCKSCTSWMMVRFLLDEATAAFKINYVGNEANHKSILSCYHWDEMKRMSLACLRLDDPWAGSVESSFS